MKRTIALGRTAALAVLGASLALSGPVQADPPLKEPIDDQFSSVVTDLCGFPVTTDSRQEGFVVEHIDETTTGTVIAHITATDTFTANGTTLVGLPYTFTIHITLVDGVQTKGTATGVNVRVPLPDGSVFRSAGQIDFLNADEDFVVEPTHGSIRNRDAFCAALS